MPYITEAQASALRATRDLDEKSRKRRKAALFADIKRQHNIPKDAKISFEVDNAGSAKYRRINDAATKQEWFTPERPTRTMAPAPVAYDRASPPVEKPWMPPAAAPVRPEAAWPIGGTPVLAREPSMVKPAPYGLNVTAPMERAQPQSAQGPELLLGSVALEDLVSLLRVEGDGRDTFKKEYGHADAQAFVRGGRLFYVL